MASNVLDKVESARIAALQAAANSDAPLDKCKDEAELQAVILFPALGTPYIAPVSEKTIKVYLIAESKCESLFDIKNTPQGKIAPLAWHFINKHMRLLPFKEAHKTSTDLKGTTLYGSKGAAKAGIKVWYRGTYSDGAHGAVGSWSRQLYDHRGTLVANLRQSAVDFFVKGTAAYGPIAPAHPLAPAKADVSNQPLEHLFEVELSVQGLRVPPQPNKAYTLAWMVSNVYRQATAGNGQPVLKGVSEWEHQDKLIYDFLWMMKEKKQHFWEPFTFNVPAIEQDKLSAQLREETSRLKAYHPVMFKDKPALHIGHLTDVHISSRHFALAASQAAVIPGISEPIGPKVTNSFVALRELFNTMRSSGADAIFLTGDLLDFNQNFNPLRLQHGATKEQWLQYDLSKQFKNCVAQDALLYPRGLDDMLAYSLIKYSYLHDCPVFVVTGNHEAYDVPYGIAPRLNGRGIAQTYQQTAMLRRKAQQREEKATKLEAEARALEAQNKMEQAKAKRDEAIAVRNSREPGEPVAPSVLTNTGSTAMADPAQRAEELSPFAEKARNVGRSVERFFGGSGKDDSPLQATLKWIKKKTDVEAQNAYEYSESRANEGIPADHNLTIYEACMAYGPSYGQLLKSWNFTPSNFDWFFMMFTPLSDFQVHYGGAQAFIGLDWGETEIMVNADMLVNDNHEVKQTAGQAWDKIDFTLEDGIGGNAKKAWDAMAAEFQGNLQGLPRADKSLNRAQQLLLRAALKQGAGKNVLFTHFTLVNYDMPISYARESRPFKLDDNTFNEYTKGSFGRQRSWLLGEVVNNGLHYAMSGHSHRAGAYRLDNSNPQAARVHVYEPALVDDNSAADTHNKLFSNTKRTRLIVSSCGGPIGMQNVKGEMFGWNLRPPAGTLLKTDAHGLDECRRIVARDKQSTPRFCVALDYMFVVAGTSVVNWARIEPGKYFLVVGHLDDLVWFIDKVEFVVWQGGQKSGFSVHSTTLEIEPQLGQASYRCSFSDYKAFTKAQLSSKGAPMFVKITFNRNLASRPMYAHYNFDDPWIFPVKMDTAGQIERPVGAYGEVPWFDWFSRAMANEFGYAGLPNAQ
jgi:hypothetical protein